MSIKFLQFHQVVNTRWDINLLEEKGLALLIHELIDVKDKLPFVLISAPSNQQQLEYLENNMPSYMKIIFKSRPAINTIHRERPFASNTVLVLDHA